MKKDYEKMWKELKKECSFHLSAMADEKCHLGVDAIIISIGVKIAMNSITRIEDRTNGD